jgi:hypothetical protein
MKQNVNPGRPLSPAQHISEVQTQLAHVNASGKARRIDAGDYASGYYCFVDDLVVLRILRGMFENTPLRAPMPSY